MNKNQLLDIIYDSGSLALNNYFGEMTEKELLEVAEKMGIDLENNGD